MSFRRGTLKLLRAVPATRREYSFFSSKTGAGRYVSATKPPKVDGQPASAASASSSTNPSDADQHPSPQQPEFEAPEQQPAPRLFAAAPRPDLTLADVRLNSFFALDRPLLLLSQPTSALFHPPPAPQQPQAEAAVAPVFEGPQLLEHPPEASVDADADAARLLSRSLVLSRVGAWADWERVLAQMGDASAQESRDIALDSTKRKKRKKMKKHKLTKRRRLLRKSNNMGKK